MQLFLVAQHLWNTPFLFKIMLFAATIKPDARFPQNVPVDHQ